ncbi:MAG TPA: gluconolaconase [Porticoccaceae bacterium]|nr:gluconolaconase [Porticoccaceae bacterium]
MNRFTAIHGEYAGRPELAEGWSCSHVTPPSALFGANGIQFGTDGRLYVAQAMGNQVTAIDTHTGEHEVISPNGGPIIGPDDVAFDSAGNMYSTEVMSERVSMRTPDGRVSIVSDGLPSANGVTVFNERLFIDEHRPGGGLFELYPHDDRPPRQIAENLSGPNALAGGPDGKLYFPLVPEGEIWRADPETGALEKVTEGLFHPTAAKFTPAGELVSPQAGNGEVAKIDTVTGEQTVIAKVRPGIDNLAFDAEGRLYLSHFVDGGVAEVSMDGSSAERVLAEPGWVGPWGIAADASGTCFIVDCLSLVRLEPSGERSSVGSPLDKSAPRFVRAVAAGHPGEFLMTTARGDVIRYQFASERSDMLVAKQGQLKGLCLGDDGLVYVVKDDNGSVFTVDSEGGMTTLVEGLAEPKDVCVHEGVCYISETGAGRVVAVDSAGTVSPILEGLADPRGLAAMGDELFVLDRGGRKLWSVNLKDGNRATTIAENLPTGADCPLDLAGGLCRGSDGNLLVAADGEGSILKFSRA